MSAVEGKDVNGRRLVETCEETHREQCTGFRIVIAIPLSTRAQDVRDSGDISRGLVGLVEHGDSAGNDLSNL
jgi:hypothetical protein